MVISQLIDTTKFPDIGRLVQYAAAVTLVITVLTAIPLFISYLQGGDGVEIITHLHVWFGVVWVIVAVGNFVWFKRPLFQFRRYL